MKGTMRTPWMSIIGLGCLLAAAVHGQGDRVLFLSESVGYRHEVVTRSDPAKPSLCEERVAAYAAPLFAVEATQDCSRINPQELARCRAVIFFTNGDLPIAEENRRALLDWVARGGAFVGLHSATGTYRTWRPFTELIGGLFRSHPWTQEVTIRVENRKHPATAHLGPSFRLREEVYQFTEWSRAKTHVLLSLDGASVDLAKGEREDRDYALAWCHDYGQGRSFYTALGHPPAAWEDERVLRHVLGGLLWTVGGAAAWATPPEGAKILLGSGAAAAWEHRDGSPSRWKSEDGIHTVAPGTGDLRTRERYGDFRLHLEFRLPAPVPGQTQTVANSGVYLAGRYEIQILGSAGGEPGVQSGGAVYGQRAPDVDADSGPGTWQTYDVVFRAPRWDAGGAKVAPARLTLVHNGILVHREVAVPDRTGKGDPEGPAPGPILLQDHGSAVAFRNLWVQELPPR